MISAECAYIFPDLLPNEGTLFPLVQLFAGLVYLAPAENDLPSNETLPALARELLTQGLLRFHCPVPLGRERQRFFHLLDELRQRPSEYSALLLAGRGNREPESQETIISALRQQGSAESSTQERLWQARLLLKLGQYVEQEEEDIRLRLRQITLREEELLRALRDDEQAAAVPPRVDIQQPENRRRLLLKAWQTLLANANEPLLASCFVTADKEAFAALMEEYQAELLLALPLPALPAGSSVLTSREHFQQAAAALLRTLPAAVDQGQWQTMLEQHYPAATHGRCLLSLHVVPGRAEEVFSGRGPTDGQHTVLALLERLR